MRENERLAIADLTESVEMLHAAFWQFLLHQKNFIDHRIFSDLPGHSKNSRLVLVSNNMSSSIASVQLTLAQAPAKPQPGARKASPPAKAQTAQPPAPPASEGSALPWMLASGGLLLGLIAFAVFGKLKYDEMKKKVKFEEFKNKDLQRKMKLALTTIQKMEMNPDLVHSREFNLDYLRLRMDEEVFHFAIVNQIKIKVKQLITVALRPTQASQAAIGVASTTGRQVDELFDVTYDTGDGVDRSKRVLFRIQVKLMKLPTQSTSTTIGQIIDCIETFLNPKEDHDTWQPTIQGRIVVIHWDQKAKPTPLLVLEQSSEGVNVSFRTNPNKQIKEK